MTKGIHFLFGQKEGVTDFSSIVSYYSELGFNCVELPPEPFLEDDGRTLRELKKAAETKGTELVFSCGFPEDCDMASDDEKIRHQGQEHLKRILALMEQEDIRLLGGTCYTKWPSFRTQPITPQEKQCLVERTADCFRETVKDIAGSPIEIALEPLNRFEGFLMNTAEEGAAFCRLVDNANVGLMLDGFHMSVEENSIKGAILAAGGYLKHLHLAENNRKLPGTGEFPWDTYFSALKEIHYQGRLDIESFVTAGGSVSASVALWRDLEVGNSPLELKEALQASLQFITAKCREYGLSE